jgi:serine/threonine-protein kinase RIO1
MEEKGNVHLYFFSHSNVVCCGICRDRERYVQGDFRFRHGYSKHNPRKMVKTWAEKEMRNLSRFPWSFFCELGL